jgi:hypothetical protein
VTNEPLRELPDFERRMAAARARASWELGDPTWADVLIGAFLDPARDHQIPTQDTATEER